MELKIKNLTYTRRCVEGGRGNGEGAIKGIGGEWGKALVQGVEHLKKGRDQILQREWGW